MACDPESAGNERAVEGQQQDRTGESELFGVDRKDEVCSLLGQKIKARLSCFEHALAHASARADCDLRLDYVIAGAERIGIGIKKTRDPFSLVGLQEAPG